MSDTMSTASTSSRLLLRWVVVALLVGALAMAISTGVGSSTGTVRGGELAIELAGYRIDPPTLILPAGEEVTLVLTNTGTYHHNVAIGRDPVRVDDQTVGFEEDLLALSALRADPGRALITPVDPALPTTVSVAPGSTVRVEVRVPDELVGEWQLGCFQGSGCEAHIDQPTTLRVE
jgi:plastocyanin